MRRVPPIAGSAARSPPSALAAAAPARGDRRRPEPPSVVLVTSDCASRDFLCPAFARAAAPDRDPGPDHLARPPRGHRRHVRAARPAGPRPGDRRLGLAPQLADGGGTRFPQRALRGLRRAPPPRGRPRPPNVAATRVRAARGRVPGRLARRPAWSACAAGRTWSARRRRADPAGAGVRRRLPGGRAAGVARACRCSPATPRSFTDPTKCARGRASDRSRRAPGTRLRRRGRVRPRHAERGAAARASGRSAWTATARDSARTS